MLLAVATVAWPVGRRGPWRGELVPLLLFGMTMAIVYRQEVALLLSGLLAWVVTLAVGHGLPEFVSCWASPRPPCSTWDTSAAAAS